MSALVISAAPGRSAPWLSPIPSSFSISLLPRISVAMPIGRFTKKIQCQSSVCVSTPPASRPIDAPPEATKLYTPIAFAWSRAFGNIVTIIPRMTADVSAPPMPWRKRAPMSSSRLSAIPQSSDATVNITRPTRNTRRRPSRSPIRPASSSRPPNGIR